MTTTGSWENFLPATATRPNLAWPLVPH